MNSLSYLSKQLDVFVTPENVQSSSKSRPQLNRINTWSSMSFLFPSDPPKRSFSSPADLVTLASFKRAAAALDNPQRSQVHIDSVLHRIFFLRVFVLVWDSLKSAWSAAVRSRNSLILRNATTIPISIIEERDSSEDEGTPLSSPPRTPSPSPSTAAAATTTTATQTSSPNSPPTPSILAIQAAEAHNSRAATPTIHARKTPFHLPKTLVLDLDETLIHSTSRPLYPPGSGGSTILGLNPFGRRNKGAGHTVEVVLGGRSTLYHVYKRPFVDFFLRTVSGWYTLVIFTASMQEYADPVIDWLDAGRGILAHRLFRDSCTQLPNGSYTKDLSVVEADLSRVCLVDNSPISYRVNEANGIPIEGWTHDPSDEALLDLLPVLDSLRFTSDVRHVLGLRSAGVVS